MTHPPLPTVGLIGSPQNELMRELNAVGMPTLVVPPPRGDGGEVDWPQVDGATTWVLAVPVPLTPSGVADTGPLVDTARGLGRHLRPGQLVVVTGPVPPTTTRRVVAPALTEHGPSGMLVAYAARTEGGWVVGGDGEVAGEQATALFARFPSPATRLPTVEGAEVCGAVGAVVRTVRAALATELHRSCERLGADGRSVFAVAGHADLVSHEPVEDAAPLFAWGCRRVRAEGRVLSSALAVNAGVVDALVERVASALNTAGRPARGSRVVVVCRPETVAVTPAVGVMQRLLSRGATIRVHDPATPFVPDDWAAEHCVVLLSDPPAGWVAPAFPMMIVDAR